MARWVLHADMDAFYASIEQRDQPELRGKPVIVGAVAARGVVAAASYEARRYGVRSAMPGFRARALCPEGVFLPSDIKRYARVSAEVHAVFREFTDCIEPIALDEAFLDITGSVGLFGGALELGRRLKARVHAATSLPVSVGIAPSKLVAKIACSLGKPDGLKLVEPEHVRELLASLPVGRLWGVGPVLLSKLEALGIRSVGDLATSNVDQLSSQLGRRVETFVRLAQGIDEREVEAAREPKSYGEENTFGDDVLEPERITETLSAHADAVGRRLRHDGYGARTVHVKMKLARARGRRVTRVGEQGEPDYPILTRSRTLIAATNDTREIRRVALELWQEAKLGVAVRLLGVSVSNLQAGATQLALPFAPERGGRGQIEDKLGPALDAIERRFGAGTIRRATGVAEKINHHSRRKRGEFSD